MANVQILGLGHALVEGVRGEAGGAPSKDSLFGVALITVGVVTSLVTFGGRRNAATFRFKTHKKADQANVLAFFQKKLVKAQGGFNYTDVTEKAGELVNVQGLSTLYAKALGNKKVNTRATAKAPKAKAVVAE